jgi:hypothetical protein
MKTFKYALLSTLFISSASFATTAPQAQVTLSSILEVVSFCSSDKSCSSITPVINNNDLNYAVQYENKNNNQNSTNSGTAPVIVPIDPTEGDEG